VWWDTIQRPVSLPKKKRVSTFAADPADVVAYVFCDLGQKRLMRCEGMLLLRVGLQYSFSHIWSER
jgi:hypothetical protein